MTHNSSNIDARLFRALVEARDSTVRDVGAGAVEFESVFLSRLNPALVEVKGDTSKGLAVACAAASVISATKAVAQGGARP